MLFRSEPVREATRLVDAVEQLLGREGLPPREGETLEDVSARLSAEAHPVAEPLARLTRRYLEARFGQRPLEPGEAARALRTLREALASWHAATRSRAS